MDINESEKILVDKLLGIVTDYCYDFRWEESIRTGCLVGETSKFKVPHGETFKFVNATFSFEIGDKLKVGDSEKVIVEYSWASTTNNYIINAGKLELYSKELCAAVGNKLHTIRNRKRSSQYQNLLDVLNYNY